MTVQQSIREPATEQVPTLAGADGVIRAKVKPAVTGGWVERARPEAVLTEALGSRRVVVLSAMAGSGKTTLVAAAARRLERPAAWLTVDSTDDAPGRLLTYLEAALAVVVPGVQGVVRDALAARIPPPEVAGLLVEAMAGEQVVLVVDELERLGDGSEGWGVIEAALRHAPGDMGFVLCSRRSVPARVLPPGPDEVSWLGDAVLALTVEEAGDVLAALGRPTVDPTAAVEATGGWVTGVLFEAWRLGEQAAGDGQEDPLYDYLAAHILGGLAEGDRDFLVATSVLTEVTADRAAAIGVREAGARLASLRSAHIPAVWTDGGRALRCHPRLREYLQDCLKSWDAERLRELQIRHGRLLVSEGRHEDATDVLLRAGAAREALEPAARTILDVIDRRDFVRAGRWLVALADVEAEAMAPLIMARLTLVLATGNNRLGIELADRLAARGKLREAASSSSAAAAMLGLCFVMDGRYDDMLEVRALAPHDADYEVSEAVLATHGLEPMPPLPELTGGPLGSALLSVIYRSGRLARVLDAAGVVGWMEACAEPWLIATIADAGRIQEAVELYESVLARGFSTTSLDAAVGPRVLTDAGRREEALATIRRGRGRARAESAIIYELLAYVEEARLYLRMDRDPVAALAALDPVDRHPITPRIGHLGAQVDSWSGFALLLQGRDGEALECLRRAVAVLRHTGQMLHMPTAAVYLAEAEWRMGNEDKADGAADLALEAAGVQGSNHMLLLALRDFPAVLSRRLDAEPAADSPWHELRRALHAQGAEVKAPLRASVRLLEFGRAAILVDGEEVRPRIAKSYELLAYLLSRPKRRAERDELLGALFEGRADDSTRACLRQAIHRLRAVLPLDAVVAERSGAGLSDHVAVVSESIELEHALTHAARLRGTDRLAATLSALEIADRGLYLPSVGSSWAQERRQHIHQLVASARYEAAELAFAHNRLRDAKQLTEKVLEAEPFHVPAWRLAMRLASARGDNQGVLRSYRRCDRALADIGTQPTVTTRQLVDQLRR